METTDKAPEVSAGEITAALIAAGASQITTHYAGGSISGLRWTMRIGGADVVFDMPARVEPVYKILKSRIPGRLPLAKEMKLREKADRVAWRQLLRWVQAQIAMIDTGMVQAGEVFLPYMLDSGRNQTLFQIMMDTQFKALPPGGKQ